MVDMKRYFDTAEKSAVQKTLYEFQMQDYYHILIDEYRYNHNESFKFLSEMPVEDGMKWVKTMMLTWERLHRSEPDTYPFVRPVDIANAVRAYRKARNKAAKKKSVK